MTATRQPEADQQIPYANEYHLLNVTLLWCLYAAVSITKTTSLRVAYDPYGCATGNNSAKTPPS